MQELGQQKRTFRADVRGMGQIHNAERILFAGGEVGMNTKNYNMATHYFREMEKENPNIQQWGAFADAMDEVISTCVPVVRCIDCKWHEMRGEMLLCKAQDKPHTYDWYCADGECKKGRQSGNE